MARHYPLVGLGTDPATDQSNDQTPYPTYYPFQEQGSAIAGLDGFGGDWFRSARPEYATFYPQTPYDVSADLIVVPGQAVTVFEVELQIAYWFANYKGQTVDDQSQSVSLDLANDALGYMVQCPIIELEILTPPPA